MHELSFYLTKTSAAFLRDALGAINRDMYDRNASENSIGLGAVQIAFDWQANDNETRFSTVLRNKKEFNAHIIDMDTKFKEGIEKLCTRFFDTKLWPIPLEWATHFEAFPSSNVMGPCLMPNEKALQPGSLAHCWAWSDYNSQRIAQHHLTLKICDALVRDTHTFKHLIPSLSRAQTCIFQQMERLNTRRAELIILEGDPVKIQAFREEILGMVCLENHSTGHFYSHFNSQHQHSGSQSADQHFRKEVLRHVQAGFNPSAGNGSADVNYSDLGLG